MLDKTYWYVSFFMHKKYDIIVSVIDIVKVVKEGNN